MEDLTRRFIEAYEYLKMKGKVKNDTDFALQLEVSRSMVTEIFKGRTKPGAKALQNIVKNLGINGNWLAAEIGEIDLTLTPISGNTPSDTVQDSVKSEVKTRKAPSQTGTFAPQNAPPTAPATTKFNLPAVVTLNENEEELITVVAHKAAAGYLNGYGDPEYIERLPTLRLPGYSNATHRAFEIKGHSMGTLHHGALAIGRWEESLDDIRDRRIYILVTRTLGIVAKRVINRVETDGKLILLSDNQNKREYPNSTLDPEEVLEVWNLRAALLYEFPEPGEVYNRLNDLEAKVTLLEDRYRRLTPIK